MSESAKTLLSRTDTISLDFLSAIINSTSDAIFVKDEHFRYLLINEAGARYFGFPIKNIIGRTDFDLLPGEFAERTAAQDKEVLTTGKTHIFEETENFNGVTLTFQTTKSLYRDKNGKFVGIFGIAREISERKKIEADRERLISELQNALNEIKTLKEILPICMHCRKIRDDEGAWMELETYIKNNTNADFSHGLCKDCYKKNYPELYAKKFPEE